MLKQKKRFGRIGIKDLYCKGSYILTVECPRIYNCAIFFVSSKHNSSVIFKFNAIILSTEL